MKNIWCNCARFKWYRLSLQQMAAAASKEDVAMLAQSAKAASFAGAESAAAAACAKKKEAGRLAALNSLAVVTRHSPAPQTVAAEIFRLQRSVHLRFRSGFIPVSRHHTINQFQRSIRSKIHF